MYQVDRVRELVNASFNELGVMPTPAFSVTHLDQDDIFNIVIQLDDNVNRFLKDIENNVRQRIMVNGYKVKVSANFTHTVIT